ncbi:hypothetical protein BDZ89DRAFT_1061876 [Hymenopellis radicata]|nr:hypothetical protein BDZ89DRAFT_1061876 [Hymenopellis radicata]
MVRTATYWRHEPSKQAAFARIPDFGGSREVCFRLVIVQLASPLSATCSKWNVGGIPKLKMRTLGVGGFMSMSTLRLTSDRVRYHSS